MRRHNIHLIKKDRSYTTAELAKLLGVHPGTVQLWHKKGMPAISDCHPLLFHGQVIKSYLSIQLKEQKHKLSPDEFWCLKCRRGQHSNGKEIKITVRGKMGRYTRYLITGICPICSLKMIPITSDKSNEVLDAMKKQQK